MNILIIGGTRNLGHLLILDLLKRGHQVTTFNRGQTKDELPPEVERLHGDRSQPEQLKQALAGRSFDAVVDTALYNGVDAQAVTTLLDGRAGHYVFLSSGQVYLVRRDVQRPFREEDYNGPIMPEPALDSRNHAEWAYGVGKRQVEDVLMQAWETRRFPYTTLRLPMVNSERDHFHRIYGYILRLKDGEPILYPAGPHLSLRHIYSHDVVQAIAALLSTGYGKGYAYNISQDETVSLEHFLELLAHIAGHKLRLKPIDRDILESHDLLPDCSPFSESWMSELDNRRSKAELEMHYTALPAYLQNLITYYEAHPPLMPARYNRRQEEIQLARQYSGVPSDHQEP